MFYPDKKTLIDKSESFISRSSDCLGAIRFSDNYGTGRKNPESAKGSQKTGPWAKTGNMHGGRGG